MPCNTRATTLTAHVDRKMVFYLIALGLGSVEDIAVRGLNAIKRCETVY